MRDTSMIEHFAGSGTRTGTREMENATCRACKVERLIVDHRGLGLVVSAVVRGEHLIGHDLRRHVHVRRIGIRIRVVVLLRVVTHR